MNNKKIQICIAFISVILIISPAYANECIWLPEDIYNDNFETYLDDIMSDKHINSLSFSILNGSEVFYSKGFGDKPGTDIAYHIMSASKMFTATAILQLNEDGLIGLEDDFNDYLPFELKNPYYPSTTITIKQLLSHRSSIIGTWHAFDHYFPLLVNGSSSFPSIIYDFLHENGNYYFEENWENWEPGTDYLYSDTGFDILTLIVENITSTPFLTYVTDNIFNPLGMTNTRHSADDYSSEEIAIGYDYVSGVNHVVPYLNNSDNPGGGGYFSTVEDMSKFMLAQLNQGDYNGTSILNPTTIELMHTEIETTKYAMGWMTRRTLGSRSDYQGHPGGPHEGFYVGNYIRSTLGVVLMLNQGNHAAGIEDITAHIFNLAHNLLNEKTCPEDTSFYLLPIISFLAVIGIFRKQKRRKE